ncbi:MAG TPA: alpha/beta fold hydrolase [Streptosporangiaceae bacterium]|nr:alpha/beta fold hydrolase [Streptosporangiaceae bacterium]
MVLLVHGFGGDRNSSLFLQEPLAARFRVYALDLPGHGTSAKDVGDVGEVGDGPAGVLADAVTGVLDALGAGRAHLVGHSMGGAQTRRELKPVVGQIFADESLVTRQLVDDLLAYKRLDGVDEALHALLDTVLLDGDAQRQDSPAALAAVGGAVPVTVIWGREDRIIPPAQADAVTGAARHLIDGAGHMPHMEKPAEVQHTIEQALCS